ncbi:MAG: phosphatidylserine/phosphatidylglycerophosphate/cardiolipin synthase family protein [Alicyclobacillus sp.]|nr:phosphatidylserine/phosphatidylglycerophosphate/cardiolipin synthase family protein [Alicyclobacillus sp.]
MAGKSQGAGWRAWRPGLWGLLALAWAGLTACAAAAGQAPGGPVPAAVTEQGVTLLWQQDIKRQALAMINGSEHSCDLDMYELSDPDILQALVAAHERGVDVRVVVDATEHHSQHTAVPFLQQHGVPVHSLHIASGISHIKLLVADGPQGGALIGGMNAGAQSWGNHDASVYLAAPNPSFAALFRWDWVRSGGSPAPAPGLQPPLYTDRTVRSQVLRALQQAQSDVAMEAYELSDAGVLNALLADAKRGVQVRVLLDPGQPQNRRTAERLRAAGAVVRFYKPDGQELMHAKWVVVDHGQTFILGSANFSHQAYTYNHEGDVVLHSVPQLAAAAEQDLAQQLARGTDAPAKGAASHED